MCFLRAEEISQTAFCHDKLGRQNQFVSYSITVVLFFFFFLFLAELLVPCSSAKNYFCLFSFFFSG